MRTAAKWSILGLHEFHGGSELQTRERERDIPWYFEQRRLWSLLGSIVPMSLEIPWSPISSNTCKCTTPATGWNCLSTWRNTHPLFFFFFFHISFFSPTTTLHNIYLQNYGYNRKSLKTRYSKVKSRLKTTRTFAQMCSWAAFVICLGNRISASLPPRHPPKTPFEPLAWNPKKWERGKRKEHLGPTDFYVCLVKTKTLEKNPRGKTPQNPPRSNLPKATSRAHRCCTTYAHPRVFCVILLRRSWHMWTLARFWIWPDPRSTLTWNPR